MANQPEDWMMAHTPKIQPAPIFTQAEADAVLTVALYQQENGTYPDDSPFDDDTLAALKSLHVKLLAVLSPPA